MEKDTPKLWQLTRTPNNNITERRQTVLEIEGELQIGKKAANTLANTYQDNKRQNKGSSLTSQTDPSQRNPRQMQSE